MARLFRADRKALVTQITALYNCGETNSISEFYSEMRVGAVLVAREGPTQY